MELKRIFTSGGRPHSPFNRTSMELKQAIDVCFFCMSEPFNRTSMGIETYPHFVMYISELALLIEPV